MRRVLMLLLTLSAVSAALVACGGGSKASSNKEPATEPTPGTALSLRAKGIKYDKKTLVTTAGADVVLTLDNQESGVIHNFALYKTSDGKDKVFGGDLFAGKKSVDYRFKAPDAGVYYFRCDAHPDDMKGSFIVKAASN